MTRNVSGIRIVYKNTGSAPLSTVRFHVVYHTIERDVPETVVDHGSFGPGVTIDHHFDAFEGIPYLGNGTKSCEVRSAS